ncbi:MAG: PAS domain S-box protein [Desulfobacteraceae bacterium]|nr:MAG: PAS domain S-box protein [Desulfobacteraceae bacterium]
MDIPADREALMTLLQDGRGVCSGFETAMRNRQGDEIPVLMSARVTEIDGESYVISQSREDSERRRIRKAFQESEKKFREMVEFLPVMVYETDQQGRLTFANRWAFSFFGYTAEDFEKGLNVLKMISLEDRERAGKNFLKAMRGEKTGEMEYQVLKKDGSRFPALIASAPILQNNRPIGVRGVVTELTGLRKVEEALKESEEKYRTVVELSQDGIVWTQGDRHILATRKMAEIFGYDQPEELLGESVLEVVHPDDRDRVYRIHGSRLRGEEAPPRYEFKGIRKTGEALYIEVSAIRTFYQGEWGSVAFLRDITDRVQAEEELKASEEKYRLVVENANEAIFIAQDGLLKLFNPKTVEIIGIDHKTLQTTPFPELIHPEDRAMVVDRHIRRARGEDLPPVYSFRIIDREGQVKWVEINAVRIDWEGRPATLNFLSDITDRRLAEEALRESEERARLIFNTVPDSITITRVEDGRYLQVNDYFCQLTGYAREETIGRTVGDLNVFVNVLDRERFIRKLRDKGEVTDFEIQYRKKDGSLFTTLLSARPIPYAGEACLVAVVTDITSRKQIEDALRKSEAQHRKLVESLREGFGVVNERNEVTYINKRFCELMGYLPEEMIGRPVSEFVDPENLNILREQGIRRRKGEKGSYEVAWIRKDGNPVYSLLSPEPVFDALGNFKGSFAVITDISERRQMEEALRKSEEKYRLLVENANEAILVIQEGLIQYVNPKAAKIMRYSDGDWFPQPFLKFIHPEDREK